MNYPQYSYYQETGLNSIKTIPTHWKMIRNGNLFQQRNQLGNLSDPILEVSMHTGVKVRDLSNLARKQIMSDASKYKKVFIHDLVYNMMRMWQGAVGVVPVNGLVSPAYIVLSPFPHTDPVYYAYLFKTKEYMSEVHKYSRGIVPDRNRLYWESFKQIPSCYPPIEEQRMIVGYLKSKTIQINKLIQKKKRLIELLKEQKQAIINQAVTRGLDPKVCLKPSGVEFIGNIPEHWDLGRLKDFARIKNGHDHKSIEVTQGYPVIGSGGPFSFSSKFLHNGESVLFGRKGTIDKPIYINGPFWTIDTMFYTEINNSLFAKFLYYCAQGFQFKYYSTQTALPSMTQQDLGKHPLQLPPLDEQHRIVLFLEKETKIYDEAINKFQNLIKLIEEHRTRLISDVVTGQIDVRNIEIADIVEEELIENILEEEQEEESLELIGAGNED